MFARLANLNATVVCLLLAPCLSAFHPVSVSAQSNLLLNGDLSEGRGRIASHWHMLKTPGDPSSLLWIAPAQGGDDSGELEIDNPTPTISAWRQLLFLPAGWYHVSAEVRVENVPSAPAGAVVLLAHSNTLAVMTVPQNGTTQWTPVGFFVREPRWGETFAMGCNLGIDRNPNSGRAWFRKIRVEPVSGPDTSGERVFDIEKVNRLGGFLQPGAVGADQIACAIVVLLLIALVAWCCSVAWQPDMRAGRDTIILAVAITVMVAAIEMLALVHFEGFYTDVQAKTARAVLAASYGPAGIYNPRLAADFYPPGSVYGLWVSGVLGRWLMPSTLVFRIMVEIPSIAANALVALTIFFIVGARASAARAIIAMLLFALNPGLVYDTVVWGQNDSMYALPMLLALELVLNGRGRLGWAAEALAILVKPQAAALVPVLGVLTLLDESVTQWLADAAVFGGTFVLAFIPFQIGHPPGWMPHVYGTLAERYPTASAGAFNLLALLGGWRVPDQRALVGNVTFHGAGIALALASFGIVAWVIWRGRDWRRVWFAAFIALFGFFLFAPRMHERYAYAALVFLVPIALDAPIFLALYVALTASFLGNLVYNMLTNNDLAFPPRVDWFVMSCMVANLAIFVTAALLGSLSPVQRQPPAD